MRKEERVMGIICGDNRFEIIARAKEHLLDATNIETDEAEMAVLDNILFRCWQMGWLDRYDRKTEPIPHDDYIGTGNDYVKRKTEEVEDEPHPCKICPYHEQCSAEDWRSCHYDYVSGRYIEPQTERSE